ncbi:MAG TPA: hypothetical protein VFY71_11040 [Planctomycetota bacterium]|nr:hypothetical protein [Planctomycetota bacterium]
MLRALFLRRMRPWRTCTLLLTALLLAAPARAWFWHSPHDAVDAWAISPDFARDRTLFLSLSRFSVLLRSRDAGQSYEVMNAGLETGSVRFIAVSPGFAQDRTLYCAEMTRLYVSHDAGEHWENLPLPPGLRVVRALALSPDFVKDGLLALGSARDGVWFSHDRGATWTPAALPAATEPVSGSIAGSVQDIHFSPGFSADQTLWAVLEGRRLVASTDGGATFSQLPSPAVGGLEVVQADAGGRTLWLGTHAGVQRSDDGGVTWQRDGAAGNAWHVLQLALAQDEHGATLVFASTATDGVWVRAPDGRWSEDRAGFRPQTDQSPRHYFGTMPSPDFAHDHTVYAATFEGLYVSHEGGKGWQWLDVLQPCIVRNLAFSQHFADDGTLWLSTYGLGLVEGRPAGAEPAPPASEPTGPKLPLASELDLGVADGMAWKRLNTLGWMFPDGIAVSPDLHVDGMLLVGTPNRVLLSSEGGAKARPILPMEKAFARALLLAPDFTTSGEIFAYLATYVDTAIPISGHFARSTDRGATWTQRDDLAVEDMVFASDWEARGRMYLAGPRGLLRSDDRGQGFQRVNTLEATDLASVALAPGAAPDGASDGADPPPDTLLVCSRQSGLHLSRDDGATWKHLDAGPMRFEYVELSPDFARDGQAFAGSETDGVLVTRDGGATWSRPPGGPRLVLCMERSPTFERDHALLVGSYEGAWLSRDAAASWTLLKVPLPADFQPIFSK